MSSVKEVHARMQKATTLPSVANANVSFLVAQHLVNHVSVQILWMLYWVGKPRFSASACLEMSGSSLSVLH